MHWQFFNLEALSSLARSAKRHSIISKQLIKLLHNRVKSSQAGTYCATCKKSSLTHFPYLTVPPCVCVRTILCGVIFFLHEMTFYAINCCKTLINLLPKSNPRQQQIFEYSTNYYLLNFPSENVHSNQAQLGQS